VPPPVIGSHQIDRYDAIKKVQKAVEANPNSLADWIILGELAHEIAMDAPADTAGKYFSMSREAFEKASALDPNNAGLKAAVQFARDQQANVDQFEAARDRHTDTFLEARRRDLASTGNAPYVKIYEPPLPSRSLPGSATVGTTGGTTAGANIIGGSTAGANTTGGSTAGGTTAGRNAAGTNPPPATPAAVSATAGATTDRSINSAVPLVRPNNVPVAEATPAVTPAPVNAPATDAANYGTRQNYSAAPSAPTYYVIPSYRPFAATDGAPYTYQQYSRTYFPPGLYDNPAVPPVSIQRSSPPPAPVVPNAFERQILNRATGQPPR